MGFERSESHGMSNNRNWAPQEFLSTTTMKLAGTVLDLSGNAEIIGDYAVV